ncbi:MAG: hypothetical protein KBC88_07695 [Alphaproteobacteria bacterium]|nr:hypothetical protein [Alphaproteobacteria bacterium]MBP9868794.1 hypothetical protein [Alphaproteobacteria bacterium]
MSLSSFFTRIVSPKPKAEPPALIPYADMQRVFQFFNPELYFSEDNASRHSVTRAIPHGCFSPSLESPSPFSNPNVSFPRTGCFCNMYGETAIFGEYSVPDEKGSSKDHLYIFLGHADDKAITPYFLFLGEYVTDKISNLSLLPHHVYLQPVCGIRASVPDGLAMASQVFVSICAGVQVNMENIYLRHFNLPKEQQADMFAQIAKRRINLDTLKEDIKQIQNAASLSSMALSPERKL